MSPVHTRRTPSRVARLVSIAVLPVLVAGGLAGCGGGTLDTTPPPGAAPPQASAPAPAVAAEKLATGWKYRFDMVSPANDNDAITTRELYLYFRADTIAVHFQVENRLGVPIDIHWDESTFLDPYGRSYKLVHRGITYATRDLPQEATHVQPGQRYSDFVVPIDLLSDPGAAAGLGGRKLLPTDLSAQSMVGRIFGPNLVFGIDNDKRQTFEVRFKVVSVYPDR